MSAARYRTQQQLEPRPLDRRGMAAPSDERPPIHPSSLHAPHPSIPQPHPTQIPHPAATPQPHGSTNRDLVPDAFPNLTTAYREQMLKSAAPMPPAGTSKPPGGYRPYMHELVDKRLDMDKSRLDMHHVDYARDAERRRSVAERGGDRSQFHNPLYLDMRDRTNPQHQQHPHQHQQQMHDPMSAHTLSPRRHLSPPRGAPMRHTLLRTIDPQQQQQQQHDNKPPYMDLEQPTQPTHLGAPPRPHDTGGGERKGYPGVGPPHATFSTPVSSSNMLSGFGMTSTRYTPVQR